VSSSTDFQSPGFIDWRHVPVDTAAFDCTINAVTSKVAVEVQPITSAGSKRVHPYLILELIMYVLRT